jgi:uncharacterized UBP type Zn finger protein
MGDVRNAAMKRQLANRGLTNEKGLTHGMAEACTHVENLPNAEPSADGCEDCLRIGGSWVHLRMCMHCGHVGCCDNSPNRHARAHWEAQSEHTVVCSFEPQEDWWFCFTDDLFFEISGASPAPSHT